MNTEQAFNAFQKAVNADPEHVREARRRRDVFKRAFGQLPDVVDFIPSGSLARGTQRDPIHDVDLIVVFDAAHHPEWDGGTGSAEAALKELQQRVRDLLGAASGTYAKEVRRATVRNHVVKCFLDDPQDDPAFAVEVMPVLRVGNHLRAPEALSDRWISIDPEHLIAEVADRHSEWNYFVPMVRALKAWKGSMGLDMKSLTTEVLALNCLPHPSGTLKLTRQHALKRFFTAAGAAVMVGIEDPAGWCGEIKPDLDKVEVYASLQESADIAARAVEAESRGNHAEAIRQWGSIFGVDFPPPGGAATGAAVGAPVVAPRIQDAPQG